MHGDGELKDLLENSDEDPPLLYPSMAKRYRDEVTALVSSLNDENHSAEASELIRSLIEKIVMIPDPQLGELVLDLHDDLAGILDMAAKSKEPLDESGLPIESAILVAGVGNDPVPAKLLNYYGNSFVRVRKRYQQLLQLGTAFFRFFILIASGLIFCFLTVSILCFEFS